MTTQISKKLVRILAITVGLGTAAVGCSRNADRTTQPPNTATPVPATTMPPPAETTDPTLDSDLESHDRAYTSPQPYRPAPAGDTDADNVDVADDEGMYDPNQTGTEPIPDPAGDVTGTDTTDPATDITTEEPTDDTDPAAPPATDEGEATDEDPGRPNDKREGGGTTY